MCFTPETSIEAFIINLLSSFILLYYAYKFPTNYNNELKIIGFMFIFVGLMQLYDYIFWTNKGNTINKVATKMAMITNHLQPIVLFLLILFFIGVCNKISTGFLFLYAIVILIYSIYCWNNIKYTQVSANSAPSLDWKWNHLDYSVYVYALFLIALVALFYFNFSYPLNVITAFFALSFFFLSLFKYAQILSAGRFWCYFAAFFPLLILIIMMFIK